MSENLINGLTPHMAPPVTREPIRSASETGDGVSLAMHGAGYYLFADDDTEYPLGSRQGCLPDRMTGTLTPRPDRRPPRRPAAVSGRQWPSVAVSGRGQRPLAARSAVASRAVSSRTSRGSSGPSAAGSTGSPR